MSSTLLPPARIPYHLSVRTVTQERFPLPLQIIWEIFTTSWAEIVLGYDIGLHAFLLMSNHFHAIVSSPSENLNFAVPHLLRETSREISRQAKNPNVVFDGSFRCSTISSKRYYEHALRYVYQNPVKAGICERVEQYPYSTIQEFLHRRENRIQVTESIFEKKSLLDYALSQKVFWLNQTYSLEETECIRQALFQPQFRFCRANISFESKERLKRERSAKQLKLF